MLRSHPPRFYTVDVMDYTSAQRSTIDIVTSEGGDNCRLISNEFSFECMSLHTGQAALTEIQAAEFPLPMRRKLLRGTKVTRKILSSVARNVARKAIGTTASMHGKGGSFVRRIVSSGQSVKPTTLDITTVDKDTLADSGVLVCKGVCILKL